MSVGDWQRLYGDGLQDVRWPWSDLVSLVTRYHKSREHRSVLELGFGTGPNIPFFLNSGYLYRGIEGSSEAVRLARSRFPEVADRLDVGDITSFSCDEAFDLVVDRAALTHNTSDAIEEAFSCIRSSLRPGGVFVGVDWFSQRHSAWGAGEEVDPFTRTHICEGQFAGVGIVHFETASNLSSTLHRAGLSVIRLEEKTVTTIVGNGGEEVVASFNFVAKR